jgi:hypothetical protein
VAVLEAVSRPKRGEKDYGELANQRKVSSKILKGRRPRNRGLSRRAMTEMVSAELAVLQKAAPVARER